MSSDDEIVSNRKKKFVVGSDSDDENNRSNVQVNSSIVSSNEEDIKDHSRPSIQKTKRKKKKRSSRVKTFDNSSDSENDDSSHKSVLSNAAEEKLTDQHSDVEKNTKFTNSLATSASEDDLRNEGKPVPKKSWYKNSDVFGSESSDEELKLNKEFENIDEKKSDSEKHSNSDRNSENSDIERRKSKKKVSSPQFHRKERKSKTKAQNEIQEIHKETQRMMREAQVSIPYHRSRQLSLAEFMERRKSIPVVSLHTTPEELSTAWKAIEQREKEAEMFYKSESSDEEGQNKIEYLNEKNEEDNVYQPENNNAPEKENTLNSLNENEDTDNTELCLESTLDIEEQKSTSTLEKIIVAGNRSSESNTDMESVELVGITKAEIQHIIKENVGSETEFQNKNFIKKSDTNLITEHQSIKMSVDNLYSVEPSTESFEDNTEMTNLSLSGQMNQNKEVGNQERTMQGCQDTSALGKTGDKLCSDERNTKSFDDPNEMSGSFVSVHKGQDKKEVEKQESKGPICDNIVATGNTEEYSLRFSETLSENESFSKVVEGTQICLIKQTGNDDSVDNPNIEFHEAIKNKLNNILNSQEDKTVEPQREVKACPENNCLKNIDNKLNKNEVMNSCDKEVENTIVEFNRNEEMRLNDTYNFKPKEATLNAPKIVDPETGIINFEEVPIKPGVDGLMKRFYTHLSYKKKLNKKTPVELNIVSAETDAGGHVSAIFEETVQLLVGEDEEEEDPTLSKPGVRRAKLQAMLRSEMGRQREVEWTKRQQEQRLYEDEMFEGEKDVCDEDDDADESDGDNDKGEDESNKESDVEEEEEESEEDEEIEDSDFKHKKSKEKNKFVDDEAEESGDGDGEDEDDEEDSFIRRPKQQKTILKRNSTADMFLSQEALKLSNAEEEELPSFQKPLTLEEKPEEVESSETSSVCPSPAFPLTALDGKDISNIYNWSAPTTPCKDYVNARTTTPVRVRGQLVDRSPLVASQDLEILCSGEFSSQPLEEVEPNETQDFHLFLEDSQTGEVDTPIKTPPNTDKESFDGKDSMRKLLVEDDDEMSTSKISKKVKKLHFSDDEDEDDGVKQALEESDHEICGEKEELEDKSDEEEEEAQPNDVDYDSEENEVVKTAGDFLDKEAELSEEEWESEDEDEQGLDALEMEEADREKINERKLQRQLGQMHIKQMLIEDKKEVRILQEMLLEDGELHSESKRQRLFRWSNNTFADDEKRTLITSDDENVDDDDDEENWRKSRHEREQYLKEHSKKVEKLELAVEEHSDSQLLRLGQKALKRMNSNSQEPKLAATVDPLASPNPKQPYKILMTRGSFLSRGNQVLSRLAQMTAGSDGPIKQPKNNRNFLFTTVSPTKDQEEPKPIVQPNNKRKRIELPLPMAKRPCAPKSKTANKKSLFEALFKAQS